MWPSLSVANHIADIANILFIGSLVVGVVSTVLIVWMANAKEGYWERARQDSDERIARLNKGAARLSTEAETARAEIAKANQGAAEANVRALEAKVELEKFPATRSLGIMQKADVAAVIKPFAGQVFDIAIPPGDSEAAVFLNDIEAALKDGGWLQVAWQDKTPTALMYTRDAYPSVGTTVALGIHVGMNPDKVADFWDAAAALAAALNSEGLPALAERETVKSAANDSVIHILIGKKL